MGEPPVHKDGGNQAGRYLLVVPWGLDHPGGVNQVVLNLYSQFEKLGPLQPLVLVLDWYCAKPRHEISVGCETIRLRVPQPPSEVNLRRLISYICRLPSTLYALHKLLVRYDVRVVNAHYPTLAFLNFILLRKVRLFRGPLLASFHGTDAHTAVESTGFVRILWRWLAQGADALVVVSDSLVPKASLLAPNLLGCPIKISNGVKSLDALEQELRDHSASPPIPKGRYILNVGTFDYKKGQDILVKAFGRLASDMPDVDLVIIGGDGPAWEQINALVKNAGLEDRVTCIRNMPHAEVLAFVKRAAVFAFPSRQEALGIATLEAGMFGVPVVATRVDGIPEVINSEDVGILTEPESDRNLELALRELLNDRERAASLGERLRKRVNSEFTWSQAWEKYVVLIDGLTEA